jgi:magnesium and cobalt exporter, CNNM family
MNAALGLLAVMVLTLGTGYFVAAEFAFVAARRTRLEELAESGDRKAARAIAVQRRLSFVLSGAQLGITATSLIVGFIAEPAFAAALTPLLRPLGLGPAMVGSIALTVGFIVATVVQMVIGELAPKNLAIARPEVLARALARSTAAYTRLAGPVIRLFDGSSNRLLRAVGIEPAEELPVGVSADELRVIITESRSQGALPQAQAVLLGRALSFRSLRAADAMVPHSQVVAIPAKATCEDLRALAVATGHSRFPVTAAANLDDVLGVAQAKDVLSIPVDQRASTPVRALVQPVLAVPESESLRRLLSSLREAHSQLALVVDEHGGTAGIVTLEDIIEEIVGEIRDEYDPAEPTVRRSSDGFLVPGSWRLDETERDTGVALPPGDYDTVAGLLLAELGRMPEVGEELTVLGASLRVEAMDGFAVRWVMLTPERPHEPR